MLCSVLYDLSDSKSIVGKVCFSVMKILKDSLAKNMCFRTQCEFNANF